MAVFTHTIGRTWSGAGLSLSSSKAYSAAAEYNFSESLGGAETDTEIACVLDVTEIKAVYFCATQDMTVEWNDNIGSQGSISLLANEPLVWHTDSYYTNLLTPDITAFFVTNASGSTGVIDFRCVIDPTP